MAEILQLIQVIVSVLSAGASALLGFMFWNSAQTNQNPFTIRFLKILSLCALLKAWEIISAAYRSSRILGEHVPMDALIGGLQGRFVELVGYSLLIWFLLRPETRKQLNGGTVPVRAGDLPASFWQEHNYKSAVRAIDDRIKPEFLK